MHKTFADESRRVKTLSSSHLHPRSNFNLNHLHSYFSNSQAETTIIQHSNTSPSLDFSKPLVVKGDGKIYPCNPTNGYISKFTDSLFSCLGCGSDSRVFRECKSQHDNAIHKVYWQELLTHVPKTWEKSSPLLSRRSQLILSPFPHLHLSPVRRYLFIVHLL